MLSSNIARPTWVEIDLDAISHNYHQFRRLLGANIRIIGCVKANAYGHGLIPVGRHLERLGIDILAVGNIEEGVALRQAGIVAPIKVFGNTLPTAARLFSDYNLMPSFFRASDPDNYLRYLDKGARLKIWVKVESGLGRLGVTPEKAQRVLWMLRRSSSFEVVGVYTHLGQASATRDKTVAQAQWQEFKKVLAFLNSRDIAVSHFQAANSAAVVDLPEMWLNTVSLGHGLYGILKTEAPRCRLNLRPAYTGFFSRLISIARFRAGRTVGGVELQRNSVIGIAPVGVGDGFSSRNVGHEALVRGCSAKIMGKISLEHLRLDITDIPNARVGDLVTLWNGFAGSPVYIEKVAARLGVPVTEVWTAARPSSVPFVYHHGAKRATPKG